MRQRGRATARSVRQWPLLIVVAAMLIGIAVAFVSDSSWRMGCLVIGAALGVAAVERIALPDREAGLLQVRSKVFDIAVLLAGAVTIIALAILVPEGRDR